MIKATKEIIALKISDLKIKIISGFELKLRTDCE
jgi:hypothetical protein